MHNGVQSLCCVPESNATSGVNSTHKKIKKESKACRSHPSAVKSPCPLLQTLVGSHLTLKLHFGKAAVVTGREPSISGEACGEGPAPGGRERG